MAVTAAKSVMAFRVLTMAVDLCRLTTRTMNVNAGHERTSKARIIHQIQLIRGITRKRTEEHPDIKMKLAKAALQFIQPGDCIQLDNSSTCWFLARQIPDIDITVVTNSLKIIQALACRDKVRIIGCGGEYSERHEDFHGPVAESAIRNFQINTFFFSCQGLNLENGIRDGSEINARLKQVMLQVSGKKILLADSSKFDQFAFCKICMLDDIDILITNKVAEERNWGDSPEFSVIEVDK